MADFDIIADAEKVITKPGKNKIILGLAGAGAVLGILMYLKNKQGQPVQSTPDTTGTADTEQLSGVLNDMQSQTQQIIEQNNQAFGTALQQLNQNITDSNVEFMDIIQQMKEDQAEEIADLKSDFQKQLENMQINTQPAQQVIQQPTNPAQLQQIVVHNESVSNFTPVKASEDAKLILDDKGMIRTVENGKFYSVGGRQAGETDNQYLARAEADYKAKGR